MDTSNLRQYLAKSIHDADMVVKLNDLMTHILTGVMTELNDTKYKQTHPELLSDAMIKEIINELGFNYIVGIMDTMSGFQFNTMLSFVELISELKGTRKRFRASFKIIRF